MRSLIPTTMSNIDLGQSGIIIALTFGSAVNYIGHTGGHDGTGVQQYVEFLFGKECGNNTSENNTTGTKYYPDVEYAVSFRSQSQQLGTFISCGIQAKSWHIDGDSFVANYDHFSRLGTYDPSDAGNNIFIEYSEAYFGKFSRISIEKPIGSTNIRNRIIITKGEGYDGKT